MHRIGGIHQGQPTTATYSVAQATTVERRKTPSTGGTCTGERVRSKGHPFGRAHLDDCAQSSTHRAVNDEDQSLYYTSPMIPDVVETLRQLIRIPSVNPMGRDVTGEQYYERALTDYLEQFFQDLGVPVCRQPVAPQRDNIMARIDAPAGDDQGSIVVFDVHQDTVPVDGMTIDPWEPRIDQGRVFGRGACDVKGAMACMLTAFARLAAERPPDMPTLIMACTVNEENGFTGARSLAQSWVDGTSPIVPRLPDQVIVAEPTGLHVVVTHKGVVRWRCHAVGRAAHSSCPDNGENAIYHMGHAVLQLQRCAEVLKQGACDWFNNLQGP